MKVSVFLTVHNKPVLAKQSISSVVEQTYGNYECIIWDSGVLYDQDYYKQINFLNDKFTVVRSDETDQIRKTKTMASWSFNQAFSRGLITGDLIIILCDDDILYKNAFETYVNNFADRLAVYASQDVSFFDSFGNEMIIGERLATVMRGSFARGAPVDCHIDYLQFCFHRNVLPLLGGPEYFSERPEDRLHADGVFMDRVGRLTPIHPVNIKVGRNRRDSSSANVNCSQTYGSLQGDVGARIVEPKSVSCYW